MCRPHQWSVLLGDGVAPRIGNGITARVYSTVMAMVCKRARADVVGQLAQWDWSSLWSLFPLFRGGGLSDGRRVTIYILLRSNSCRWLILGVQMRCLQNERWVQVHKSVSFIARNVSDPGNYRGLTKHDTGSTRVGNDSRGLTNKDATATLDKVWPCSVRAMVEIHSQSAITHCCLSGYWLEESWNGVNGVSGFSFFGCPNIRLWVKVCCGIPKFQLLSKAKHDKTPLPSQVKGKFYHWVLFAYPDRQHLEGPC